MQLSNRIVQWWKAWNKGKVQAPNPGHWECWGWILLQGRWWCWLGVVLWEIWERIYEEPRSYTEQNDGTWEWQLNVEIRSINEQGGIAIDTDQNGWTLSWVNECT